MAQTITALQQEGHTVVLTAGPDKKELAMIDRILAASPKTGSSLWGPANVAPAGLTHRSCVSFYWR